jgi:predicted amidohydrolase
MANAPADASNMRSQSQSHGNSKIIHPNGTVLTEAGYFPETLVAATIDLKAASRSIARRCVEEATVVRSWLQEGSKLVEEEQS